MATKHGVSAILYMGATNAIAITETTSIDIGVTTDFAEDSSQGDTFKTSLPGLSTFDLKFTRHFDSAAGGGALQAAVIARTLQKFYAYPDRGDATIYWSGTGYLGGGGMKMPIGDIVDADFTFEAAGQPTYTHP